MVIAGHPFDENHILRLRSCAQCHLQGAMLNSRLARRRPPAWAEALIDPQHDVSAEGAPISLPSSKAHGTQAMSTSVVTSQGQITIPADVRQALQVKAGDRVEFVQIETGRFEAVAATRPVTDLKGLFGRPSKAVWIDAMNNRLRHAGHRLDDRPGQQRVGSLFHARRQEGCQGQHADRILERRQAWLHFPHRARGAGVGVGLLLSAARDQLVQALDALLPTKERVVDRADQVIKALRLFKADTARLILPTVGWSVARQAPVAARP
jgi:antitoxin PrlF